MERPKTHAHLVNEAARLSKAIQWAAIWHGAQLDLSGRPYILHPLRVMAAARDAGFQLEVQIAAVLHDTIEDTLADYAHVEALFGTCVADAVQALTRFPEDSYLETYLPRVMANPLARAAKRFDIIDNMTRPRIYTPDEPRRLRKYAVALEILNGTMSLADAQKAVKGL